jgi:hypothetical protein
VEAIIAHLAYDIPSLKACAATCFTWYNFAFPHLHHTLIFQDRSKSTSRTNYNPLLPMHQLGLLPFVKKAQFNRATYWVAPAIFDSRSMRYFRALVNLQDLAIASLDFSFFPSGVGEFFGHFSPTLRSLSLWTPLGNRRQLLDFFRLFPRLDDVMICEYSDDGEYHEALDDMLIPIGGGLRGQLNLKNFHDEWLLKDMIVAFGGMRFTSMRLESVLGVPLILKACADTLQTVYIHPGNRFRPGKIIPFLRVHIPDARTDVTLSVPPPLFDFSHCTALRSLEIPLHSTFPPSDYYALTIRALSTITSPAFSEIVIVFVTASCWQKSLAEVLVQLYKIKEFRVVFCLQVSEESRALLLQRLTLGTRKAVAEGTYDFLPCPPLVCSRPVSSFDRICRRSPVMA